MDDFCIHQSLTAEVYTACCLVKQFNTKNRCVIIVSLSHVTINYIHTALDQQSVTCTHHTRGLVYKKKSWEKS